MKKIKAIFPLVFFLLFIGFVYKSNTIENNIQTVEKGTLDLSTFDIETNGPVTLNGNWAFYSEKSIAATDINTIPDGYFKVPAEWNTYKINGKLKDKYGFATYRLDIKGLEKGKKMGIKIRECGTSYEMFVNGERVAHQGVYSEKEKNGIPDYKPQVIFFEGGPNTDIVLHISNYNHRAAGIWYSLILGTEEDIIKIREKKLGLEMFLFGILSIMGLYYISIFILRKKEAAALYFGLFCISIAIRLLVTGENFMGTVMNNNKWELMRKVEYISLYFCIPLFYAFIYSLFKKYINKILIIISIAVTIVFTAMTLFTEIKFYSNFLYILQIYLLISIIIIVLGLTRALFHRENSSGIILYGFVFFIVAILNDIGAAYSILQSDFVLPMATLVFIFCQSLVLQVRFTDAFNTVEKLATENLKMYNEISELNRTLEKKVEARTNKLSETIRTLSLTQEKLIATEKMASLGVLASGIAHELNSPLGAVITNTQLIKGEVINEIVITTEEKEQHNDIMESLDLILSAASKAKETIAKLLKYSNAASTKNEAVMIDTIVKNVMLIYDKNIEDNGIEVCIEIKDNLVLYAEGNQITGVIENIIENAIDSLKSKKDENKIIEIKAYKKYDNTVIEIYDNGKGMSDEDIERIFDPFIVSQNKSHGLRVELNISKDVIRKYNGDIKIESKEGEFTRFVITFKKGEQNE